MVISSSAKSSGDALYLLGCEMQHELDNLLFEAISARQGGKVDLLSFKGRLNCVRKPGSPDIYCLDGAPLLRVWPVAVNCERGPDGDTYIARQRIEPVAA